MIYYAKVAWHHDFHDEPVFLYSEVADRHEVRKVEIYRDGTADYADADSATGTTMLGEILMPSIAEISGDAQFSAEEASKAEFNIVWEMARARHA